MRLLILFFVLISTSVFGQEKLDSVLVEAPEWSSKDYTQVDKIFNRSVWTFTDNPALVGYDRKLTFAYQFQMKNLSIGVPNDEGNMVLGFMSHEAFADFAFGGKRKNWGVGIYYNYEKELQHIYNRIEYSHSYRVAKNGHQIIFGFGVGLIMTELKDWHRFVFGDMIDPRFGFIYQTNEETPNQSSIILYPKAGFHYSWKRLFFDYSFQYGPNEPLALAGGPVSSVLNNLRLGYRFFLGDEVTISPEFVARIKTSFYDPILYAKRKYANDYPLFSGFTTISFKDLFYGQIGFVNHNRLSIRAGYQFKDLFVVEVGTSGYTDKAMREIAGWGSVETAIRIQINTLKK